MIRLLFCVCIWIEQHLLSCQEDVKVSAIISNWKNVLTIYPYFMKKTSDYSQKELDLIGKMKRIGTIFLRKQRIQLFQFGLYILFPDPVCDVRCGRLNRHGRFSGRLSDSTARFSDGRSGFLQACFCFIFHRNSTLSIWSEDLKSCWIKPAGSDLPHTMHCILRGALLLGSLHNISPEETAVYHETVILSKGCLNIVIFFSASCILSGTYLKKFSFNCNRDGCAI